MDSMIANNERVCVKKSLTKKSTTNNKIHISEIKNNI